MIERLCKEFLANIGDNASSFEFTPKLKKGLNIPDDAVVYLAHDDTMFHSGKDGFAITDQGIYCKPMSESLAFTSFEEMKGVTSLEWAEDNGGLICADDNPVAYVTGVGEETEEALMNLLSEIIAGLSGNEVSPATTTNGQVSAPSEPAPATSEPAPASSEPASVSSSGNMGFKSVSNVQGFTDEVLLEKLSAVKVSFGTPIMGDINGTPSVMYKNVTDEFDVFCRVNGKDVIMGKMGADGISGVQTAVTEGLSLFLGVRDESTTTANRAVDELCSVVEKLERGEEVAESDVYALGEAVSLYMVQKAISLKPKFDIFDENENAIYHVEGDISRLNFSIQRNGAEVLKLKKKLVAIMPEYSIEKDKQEIAKIKKKLKLTNPELNGQVNGKELKINGDLWGFDFDILVGGAVIGHVDKDFGHWSDHYRIRSFDPNMQDIVIALAIICDNVADKEESN